MTSKDNPSPQLTEHWTGLQDGWIKPIIQNSEAVEVDPMPWQPNFRKAGLVLANDFGLVKIHILHYVWKCWRNDRLGRILLMSETLAQNCAKKQEKKGESTRGTGVGTVRSMIRQLIADGYLIRAGRDKYNRPFVWPAWSLAFSSDPVSTLRGAHKNQIAREMAKSKERRRRRSGADRRPATQDEEV